MNCFFILLLCFFTQVRCDTADQNGPDISNSDADLQVLDGEKTDVLASVRQFPSLLHKCTGTFIAQDVLLTTAKCLYCEDCYLFVHIFSSTLTDESEYSKGQSVDVKKAVIHPDYERAPEGNNIGLIQLVSKISKVVLFYLQASVPDTFGLIVETYRWKFTNKNREFNLEKTTEKTISNAACSTFFETYIDYKHVCTSRNDSILLGKFDEGVPIVDSRKGYGLIMGIYEAERKIRPSRVESYQAIFPFVDWIKKIIACNFKCSGPSPFFNKSSIFATTSETPFGDNGNSPIFPTFPLLIEPGEVEEAEPEKKAAGGESSQRDDKPLWSSQFPIFEQKQTPFKPKIRPGKRFY